MTSPITKNTFYLTSALVAQKFFSFIYFTLIARQMGVAAIGLYTIALSFSSLFSVLTDLGLTPVLIREGAKDNQKAGALLGNLLTLKIFLALFAYAFLNLVVYLLGYPVIQRELIWLSGLIMALDAFSLSFYGVLRSFQKLSFEAVGMVGGQIITIVAGLIVLKFNGSLIFLLLALALGSLFNVCWSGMNLIWRYQVWPRFLFNVSLLKTMARYALPFALAGIFVKVYSYIDVIILSRLLGPKEVGWYSVPSKITFAFQFIPMALAASLYPAMSQFFVQDRARLRAVFEKGLLYLAMLALPISFGLAVLGELLIVKLYGPAYLPSILPLKILLASLVFAFLDFPVGSLLNACHRQSAQTTVMGGTMTLNIILNLILIPNFGILGAAISALAGNFILFLAGFLWVPKIIPWPNIGFWWKMLKTLLAAAVMGGVIWLMRAPLAYLFAPQGFVLTTIYLGSLVLSGAAVYAVLLLAFGLISKEKVKEMVGMLKKNYDKIP